MSSWWSNEYATIVSVLALANASCMLLINRVIVLATELITFHRGALHYFEASRWSNEEAMTSSALAHAIANLRRELLINYTSSVSTH